MHGCEKVTLAFSSTRFLQGFLWLNDTHLTAKLSEWNMPARNMLVQLLTLCTNPDSHNGQRHRQNGQTDGCTDDKITPMTDHTV